MAKKLFAMEDSEKDDELMIDKVIRLSKSKTDPISLTSALIDQRQELKKEVKESLEKDEDDTEEGGNDNEDNTESDSESENKDDVSTDDDGSSDDEFGSDDESDSDEDKDDDTEDDQDEDDKKDDKSSDEKKDDTKNDDKDKSDEDDEDHEKIAQDSNAVDNVIGSGLNKKAAEEFKVIPKLVCRNKLCEPIVEAFNAYTLALESIDIPNKLTIQEQPIAHIKEEILKTIQSFIEMTTKYQSKQEDHRNTIQGSVKKINERLVILKEFIESNKFKFTNKLIKDQEILSSISIQDKSDYRSTSKPLNEYIKLINHTVSFILKNDFKSMKEAIMAHGFISDKSELAYKTLLPGFNVIKFNLGTYKNYINTDVDEFECFRLKVIKTADLYNIPAIAISEDKDLLYIVTDLSNILVELSTFIDSATGISVGLHQLEENLKLINYDVEHDKITKLADIDIDTPLKDLIKLKVISEAYRCSADIVVDYILNTLTVIDQSISLQQ